VARTYANVLVAVWRGNLAGAAHTAARPWFWLWVFALNAVLGGAAWATVLPMVSRMSSMVGRTALGLDGSVAEPDICASQVALVAVAGLVATFVAQLLRVLAVRLTFAVRATPVGWLHATVPVVVGAAPLTVVYGFGFLVGLVPTTNGWFVAAAVATGAIGVIVAETLVFVTVERTTASPVSILIPHAALTVAWAVAAFMLTALAVHLTPV